MALEKLNLAEVQKHLEPTLQRQQLAHAKDDVERALMLDVAEAEKSRIWTIEQLVLVTNAIVDLTQTVNGLVDSMRPYRMARQAASWVIGSAAGLGVVAGVIWFIFKLAVKNSQ